MDHVHLKHKIILEKHNLLYVFLIIQNASIIIYVCNFCKQFLLTGLCDWKSLDMTVLNKDYDFNLRFITGFIFSFFGP